MIHKDNAHPEGKYIPPDRRIFATVSPCITRQMTEEEREKYGEAVPREEKQKEKAVERPPKKVDRPKQVRTKPSKDYAFAAKLRAERKRLGMGTPSFSKMLGVPQSTIEAVENCKHGLRRSTKEIICKALGWECDDIDDQ